MKKWQAVLTYSCGIALGVIAIFLGLFLCLPQKELESQPPTSYAEEVSVENLPTDYWKDIAVQPATGTGTITDPYIVTTAEELAWFSVASGNGNGKYIELGTDLDLSGHLWSPMFAVSGFDGKNHTISGLTIHATTGGNSGLFGQINRASSLSNFRIANSLIYSNSEGVTAASYIGFVQAQGYSTNYVNYQNVSVQDSEIVVENFSSAQYVAPIIGYNAYLDLFCNVSAINVNISLSTKKTTINYYLYTGGLVGTYGSSRMLQELNVIDKVRVYIDVPSNFNRTINLATFNSTAYARYNYIDYNYSNSSTTPFTKISKIDNYEQCILKTANLTSVPNYLPKDVWSDADSNNGFTSIFPKNDWFIKYHNLTSTFVEPDYWINYAVEPVKKSDGTYDISTPEELAWFVKESTYKHKSATAISYSVNLLNDIDLAGKLWTPLETYYVSFTLNGKNHAIKNMTFDLDYRGSYSITSAYCAFLVRNNSVGNSYALVDTILEATSFIGEQTANTYISPIGLYSSTSSGLTIRNVLVKGLQVDITTKPSSVENKTFTLWCYSDNVNLTQNETGSRAVLDMDVKINANSSVEVKDIRFTFGYNYNHFTITGKIKINTTYSSARVKLGGENSKSGTTVQYYINNSLVNVDVNITKDGSPFGEVTIFDTYSLGCMYSGAIEAQTIVMNTENQNCMNSNELDPESWSLPNADNENWPYMFCKNTYFMNYYGLTFITNKNSWSYHYVRPTDVSGNDYHVYTAEELAYFSYICSNTTSSTFNIYLEADIDLGAYKWVSAGNEKYYASYVNLYGQGHTISNMDVGYETSSYTGFIGRVRYGSEIKDVTFVNPRVRGMSNCAVVVNGPSNISNVHIINCNVKGVASYVSGLASTSTTIENCSVSGSVIGGGHVAGVCYSAETLSKCVNYADIENTGGSGDFAGVVVSANNASNCVNYGKVSCTAGYPNRIYGAGIVSRGLVVESCMNYGEIYSKNSGAAIDLAGIVGTTKDKNAKINNCNNYGDIKDAKATNIGGILGSVQHPAGTITNCSNYGELNNFSTTYCAGIVANLNSASAKDCKNFGDITIQSGYSGTYVGGLFGTVSSNGRIESCFNSGDIASDRGTYVGGIVGFGDYLNLKKSVNIGNVSGRDYVGGIVGMFRYGGIADSIAECYVSSLQTSNTATAYIGGFAGYMDGGTSGGTTIMNSYFSGTVNSITINVGGLVGQISQATRGTVEGCLVNATINAGIYKSTSYGVGGIVGTSASTKLTISNTAFKGEIVSDAGKVLPFVYKTGGAVTYQSCYYDAVIKKTEDGEATTFKSYILGADETEESAFNADVWLLNDKLSISAMPVPRVILWQSENLENTQNVLEFLKSSGFTQEAAA